MPTTCLYKKPHRQATWLELFFDLVFVAAIGSITHNLAHVHNNHLDFQQVIIFLAQFIPIWWIWVGHTTYSNRYDTDSKSHRLITLAIMFLLMLIPTFLSDNFEQNFHYFALIYSTTRIIIASLYLTVRREDSKYTSFAKKLGKGFMIGALISSLAFWLPAPYNYLILYIGLTFDLLFPPFIVEACEEFPIHLKHLVERTGLLSIILLGESIISLVASLQGVEWQINNIIAAISGFIIIGSIWWIYFDSFQFLERAKKILTGLPILYAHLLLCIGFIFIANTIGHAILSNLTNPDFSILAVSGLLFFYLGKQIPYFIVFPIFRKNNIINTLICISITVASAFLSKPEYTLVGMMLAVLVYVLANNLWTLTKDASQYLKPTSN